MFTIDTNIPAPPKRTSRAAVTEIIEKLAASCPVKRTSPNAAPVYDVLQSFVLTALTDGRQEPPAFAK